MQPSDQMSTDLEWNFLPATSGAFNKCQHKKGELIGVRVNRVRVNRGMFVCVWARMFKKNKTKQQNKKKKCWTISVACRVPHISFQDVEGGKEKEREKKRAHHVVKCADRSV